MRLTNNTWVLLFSVLLIFVAFNVYDDLNFVKISLNQASAISPNGSNDSIMENKEKIKVDIVEKLNAKDIQSIQLAIALNIDVQFEKSSTEDFMLRLEGSGDIYKNSGTQISDWFKKDLKKGRLSLRNYETKLNAVNNLSELKKIIKKIDITSEKHEVLKLVIQYPEGFEFHDLTAELVSSNLKMKNVLFKNALIKTVSGQIEIKDSEGGNLEVTTVSGDSTIELRKIKNAKFESVSGQTLIVAEEVESKVSYHSVSGDLKLKMPKEANVDVLFESMSGVLKNEFGISKNTSTKVEFSSLSGNAELTKIKK